mgnify:FL=1
MDKSLDARMRAYRDAGVKQVVLGLADVDGVIRGKFVDLSKLEGLMAHGGGFCDCILGWDVNDQLYDRGTYTGWHTGFPDTRYRLVTDTERAIPGEGTPYFIGEFVDEDEDFHPVCPRSCLRRVLTRLGDLGYTARSGFEYEFFVFKETPESIREKGYRDLTPVTPGNFGYSVLRAATQSEAFNGLMDYCREFEFPLEGLHCETGPGEREAALSASEGIEAADQASLFKNFSKVYFQKRGELATFMAKWSMDYPGQSGHYHFSLLDAEGKNAFASAEPGDVPDTARYALGGLMHYLPEWLPMLAPTVNSFTRLVRGAWAPTSASWGIENRTAAFRFIPGDASRQHVENRVGGADGNPYLTAAATLGAAALGIEEKIEPIAAVIGNAYEQEGAMGSESRFSPTLRHAATRMGESKAARRVFGDAFVEHFVGTRIWEAEESERSVNDWQLDRYLEII